MRCVWVALLLLTVPSVFAHAEQRRFTVADSIGMTHIVDPPVAISRFRTPEFKLSPDGETLAIVTRRGDLKSGKSEFSLLLFGIEGIRDFVNDDASRALPHAHVAARVSTAAVRWGQAEQGIHSVRWLADARTIGFIGRGTEDVAQVYTIDVSTETLRRLTNHPRDVAAFDLAKDQKTLLFSAYAVRDWTARNSSGYAVESHNILHLSLTDASAADPLLEYFIEDVSSGQVRRISIDYGTWTRPISISPSGRWATVANQVVEMPAHWSEYEFVRDNPTLRHSESGSLQAEDAFSGPAPWLVQYYLIDLLSGKSEPLIDAPALLIGAADAAVWSPDSERILLPVTFLPLSDAKGKERELRKETQAVVEVTLATRAAQRVVAVQAITPDKRNSGMVSRVEWGSDGSVVVAHTQVGNTSLPPKRYRKAASAWREVGVAREAVQKRKQSMIEFRVAQDVNTPPDLLAFDPKTDAQRPITDLNPQLREIQLGRVETFEWRDRLGRTFKGGLVLPPNYVSKPHPVVIQTYGFEPGEFLVDGPYGATTAYAARALAARDIVVLQAPALDGGRTGSEQGYENVAENPRFLVGLEGAIDALILRKIADPMRIGLIGFSREGMHVHYAVAFSRHAIAAATVADSVMTTPFCYSTAYSLPYPGMLDWEREPGIAMGGPLWAGAIELWVARSEFFNLDRIRAPLRYERMGIGTPCFWDTFALLKRQRRPVELIHMPFASHNVEQPLARFTSQQGNVDWFAYWLKDEEDADPEKRDQYLRWRKLRAQRDQIAEGQ